MKYPVATGTLCISQLRDYARRGLLVTDQPIEQPDDDRFLPLVVIFKHEIPLPALYIHRKTVPTTGAQTLTVIQGSDQVHAAVHTWPLKVFEHTPHETAHRVWKYDFQIRYIDTESVAEARDVVAAINERVGSALLSAMKVAK